MTLPERFDRHLAGFQLPEGPTIVAVSGGPDSLALLDLLAAAPSARTLRLIVAHVDHGIAAESAAVAAAVEATASRYGLPFRAARLGLGARASETRAREARYAALFAIAAEAGAAVILTGHQQDDQVETILMRLLHGSGPAGLAGMAPRRGSIVRPLLPFRRDELAGYLRSIGLVAWEDPANRELGHERSWIRNELLPSLRRRIPDIDRRMIEIGRGAAADRSAWESLLEQWPALDFREEPDGVSVAAPPLSGYDSGILRGLLGGLGRRAECTIGARRAGRIERLLSTGRSGAVLELGSGHTAELSFGRLHLRQALGHPLPWAPVEVTGAAGRATAGRWAMEWSRDRAPARLYRNAGGSWFVEGRYRVRPWRPGDRIRPLGGQGRRLVVRCMQDARIARSARAAWPVVEREGIIVWVPGVCRAGEQIPEAGTPALRIDAHLG